MIGYSEEAKGYDNHTLSDIKKSTTPSFANLKNQIDTSKSNKKIVFTPDTQNFYNKENNLINCKSSTNIQSSK